MKRRSTDQHDEISEVEVKAARVPWWKALKLFIMNLPVIAKVVLLVIGAWGGSIAVPEAIDQVNALISDNQEAALIPTGQVTTPAAADPGAIWRSQVNTALASGKLAIDTNTAAVEALRAEIRELEKRVAAKRARGDTSVEAKVTANANRLTLIEEIVQP